MAEILFASIQFPAIFQKPSARLSSAGMVAVCTVMVPPARRSARAGGCRNKESSRDPSEVGSSVLGAGECVREGGTEEAGMRYSGEIGKSVGVGMVDRFDGGRSRVVCSDVDVYGRGGRVQLTVCPFTMAEETKGARETEETEGTEGAGVGDRCE